MYQFVITTILSVGSLLLIKGICDMSVRVDTIFIVSFYTQCLYFMLMKNTNLRMTCSNFITFYKDTWFVPFRPTSARK